MLQLFEDKNSGPFTDDQALPPLVEGFAAFGIDQLQAAESAEGDFTQRVTPASDHHISQTHLNHLIGHTRRGRA